MERSTWFLLTVALATIEVLTSTSRDFQVHGYELPWGAQLGSARGFRGQVSPRTQGWNRHLHYEGHERKADHGLTVRNLESEHNSEEYGRATSRHQLKQAGPSVEVEVLIAFKEGITSDPLGALASWKANDSDPCDWTGVTCSQGSTRVIALELDNLRLTGTISQRLGTLTFLQQLSISSNFFHGNMPASLINCSYLTYLVLSDNNLDGAIPSQLGSLQNLQYLDLSSNLYLGGTIPASVGNCSSLALLRLDYTSVGGEIPSSLGQLARLQSLNLSMTLTNGTIPKSLGNCSALTFLYLGNLYDSYFATTEANVSISGQPPAEYLTGELPVELGQLVHLTAFGLAGADITGVFPPWIANLTALNGLLLINCFLTGQIPDHLGSLPLELLGLSHTNFTGEIPKAISNCSNLWFLTIETNPLLSGVMPPELGLLSELGALSLTQNNLIGTIPAALSNCSRLRAILLGENPFMDPQPMPTWLTSLVNITVISLSEINLIGEIPTTIGQMSQLDSLFLPINNLSGAIPRSLGNCSALTKIWLYQNQLSGQIPSEIWNLQLSLFVVENNFLRGPISESIGNCSQCHYLTFGFNLFNGRIPSQLGNLQNLLSAQFQSNNFSGPIPVSIGNCSALHFLSFSQNQLSGLIPSSVGNLTTLQQLWLEENLLEGPIPADLMRCTQLAYLHLSQNSLVGRVPEEIGALVLLQDLFLDNNQLSGVVPRSIGFCEGLIHVDISSNRLNGSIPGGAFANLSNTLFSLNLSRNFFSDSLPQELGVLERANYLNFSNNDFSGSIPSSLSNCQGLKSLDLSVNNFSGGIPASFGRLRALEFINLSYNHLEGSLPVGGIFNSSNLSVGWFVGNPELCGGVFSKVCPENLSPSNASGCTAFHCNRAGVAGTSVGAVVALIILGVLIYKSFGGVLRRSSWLPEGTWDDNQLDNFGMGLVLSKEDFLGASALPENMIIGKGERSTVYKKVLPEGKTIAVKILTSGNTEDEGYRKAQAELHKLLHNLSYIKHRNIVKVLGLMSSQTSTALFMEYVPNGSLYKQLYEVEECVLSWGTRLQIAVGIADGLFYLHSQAHEPVIHRDLKPANILLDEDMVPKLADFGISKAVKPQNKDNGETSASNFCGTMGYIPPEYGVSTKVSTKGDVYSYGVILLELLTRKHPLVVINAINNDLGQPSQIEKHIVDWVLEETHTETPLAVLDPMLLANNARNNDAMESNDEQGNERDQMRLFLQVGLLCTQARQDHRPEMSDVLAMLKQIQEKGLDLPNHATPTVEELANEASVLHTQDKEHPSYSVSF